MTLALGNPVMTKEMRSRLRGAKGLWVQAAYLLILSGIVGFMYLTWSLSVGRGGGDKPWEMGQLIFRVLSVSQAVLIALIAPALTCGAITLERERQTMDFLLMTPLKAVSIVVGKLLSAFLFMGLLLVLSIPLASVSFLLGGVSPGELAGVYSALLVEAILLCSVGLAWSATFPKTTISTPFAYGTTLAFMAATATLFGMSSVMRHGSVGRGAGGFALGGMNPVCLPFISAEQTSVFGWRLPVAVPGVAVNLLIVLAVLAVAVHRVACLRGRSHATAARLLTCLAVVAMGTVFAGDMAVRAGVGRWLKQWAMMMAGLFITTTAVLGLLTPVFATGEPPEGMTPLRALGRALNPLRVFHGEAPTAAGYLVLMLLLILPSVAGSLAGMKGTYTPPRAHAPPPPPTTVRPAPSPAGPGVRVTPPARPVPPPPAWSAVHARQWCWGVVKDLCALMICTLLAYVAIGWAASAVTGNRWIAMGVAFALVLVLGLVPFTGASDISYEGGQHVRSYGNILYASPYFAALWLVEEECDGRNDISGFWLDGIAPFETVTMAIHLCVFVLFSGIACLALSDRRRNDLKDVSSGRAPPKPKPTDAEGPVFDEPEATEDT